jgi:threonine dehydrogenase-like Zn-dependent dehydrogenase
MPDRPVRSLGVAGPGRPALLALDEPEPGPGQVWLRTLWSGISAGTEVALVRGTDPHHRVTWDRELRSFAPGTPTAGYPIRGLGYMEVARITESHDPDLPVGTVVAAAYGHQTGRCAQRGRDVVVPLPPDLDPVLGVFVAQLGPICVNGLLHAAAEVAGPDAEVGDGVRGRRVLVTGAGTIGLLSALLARRHGAEEVLVAEPSADRAATARALGLEVLDDSTGTAWLAAKRRWQHGPGDHGADVVLQCRGLDTALATALKAARPQATVVDLAFYQGGADAVRLGEEFHHNSLAIRCAQISRVPRALAGRWDRDRMAQETLGLLRDVGDRVRETLVTDLVPFEEGPRLLADLAAHRRSSLTAVLCFPEDADEARPAESADRHAALGP